MFGEPQKMQIGAIVEDRATHGDADSASEIAHQVEQAGCQLQAFGCEAAQGQGHRRRHREQLREAAEGLWQEQLLRAPIMGDRREVPHAQRETRQTGHQQPA